VHDRLVATLSFDVEDLGFAGFASLGVLDAVSLGWVIIAQFLVAEDDFEVGGLVQALRLADVDAADKRTDSYVGVRTSD